MRYAVVDVDGLVTNVILWDGEAEFECSEELIELEGDSLVGPGWWHESGEWIAPPEEPNDGALQAELDIIAAREAALQELTAIGVSEATARTIVGLPALGEE